MSNILAETFDSYERSIEMCAPPLGPLSDDALVLGGLGLTGEAGEVADVVKKHLYHGHALDTYNLLIELGDVLWYVSYLARTLGSSLGVVASINAEKLAKRYPHGFSSAASIDRADLREEVSPSTL